MQHGRPDYQRIQDPAELIPAGEPVFLLRGHDPCAALAVEHWADLAEERGAPSEALMARVQAENMRRWQQVVAPERTRPDRAWYQSDQTRYHFRRDQDGARIGKEVPPTRGVLPLRLFLELCNHSPDGFQWGYGGSGPAQTALALLRDFTGSDALALRYYRDFQATCVSHWLSNEFTIRGVELRRWLDARMGCPIPAELDEQEAGYASLGRHAFELSRRTDAG